MRMTQVDLTEELKHSTASSTELEEMFYGLEMMSQLRNEAVRAAAEAAAQAQIRVAEERLAMVKFLKFASTFSTLVATEENWLRPFKNKENHIILENPFTIRDQRLAARSLHSDIHRRAEDSNIDMDDAFGDDE
jgi:hypothetical protein